MHLVRSLAATFLAVLVLPLSARGQAAPSPSPATPTFTSSVTETIDVAAHAATTEHVGRNDIEARHALTLDEALTFVPGVRVRNGGDGRPVLDVRGLRPRQVLLLLDGVPLHATNDGQFDPALVPAEFLQDVTLTFGASSVLYGDGALGGVLELTPRTVPGFQAGGDVDWRNGNQRGVSGHVVKGTARVNAMLAARSFAADGFRLPDGGTRANSDSDQNAAIGKISLALSRSWRIAGLATLSSGGYGIPPSVRDATVDPFAQRTRYERVENFRTRASQFSWDYKSERKLSARGWVFLNEERQHRARYDGPSFDSMADEAVQGTFDTRDRSRVSGGAVHGRYNFGRMALLKASFNVRREEFISTGVIRDIDLSSPSTPPAGAGGRGGGGSGGQGGGGVRRFGLRGIDSDAALSVASSGVEWEGRPGGGVGLVAGYAANVQTAARTPQRAGPTLLAGMFKEWTVVTLHAAAFRRVRFPSIADLYEAGSGNPDLKPEESRGVEAGIDRRLGGARVNVSGFVTATRNFIQRSDDLTHYVNRDRYRLTGVDASLQTPVTSRGLVRSIYSFLDAVDVSPGAARSQLQYQPRHRVSLENRWAVTPSTLARVEASWVGREWYYSRTLPVIGETLKPYTLVDADVTRALAGHRVWITAGVTNVFDVSHESPYGMPQAGRTAYISLRTLVGN